mmetsp:Transcript_65715/g.150611  ORF Transcript_65715/g.150611 Transcript_65715/m.150611 type:complete len:202 (+) Transcript_65715:3737-4342(+)
MQGREPRRVLDRQLHVWRDDSRFTEAVRAVHHAVPHHLDVRGVFDEVDFWRREVLDHFRERLAKVLDLGNGGIVVAVLARGLVRDDGLSANLGDGACGELRRADFLPVRERSLRQPHHGAKVVLDRDPRVRDRVQRVLEARASSVQNQRPVRTVRRHPPFPSGHLREEDASHPACIDTAHQPPQPPHFVPPMQDASPNSAS